MVIDDAFRVAGRARGVVERDRRPFVLRWRPRGGRIALAEKILIFGGAWRSTIVAVRDLDQRDVSAGLPQGMLGEGGKFAVGEEQPSAAMPEDERDRRGVEPV